MPDDKGRFSSAHRAVKVERVVVNSTVVDMDYNRVELCIDGEEYEFCGPDAQVLGAHLNMAGGGDIFAKATHEDALMLIRRVVLGQAFDRGDPSKLALINDIVGEALYGSEPGTIAKAREQFHA